MVMYGHMTKSYQSINQSIQTLLLSVHKYMATRDTYKHNYKEYNRGISKSKLLKRVNMWILQACAVLYNILYFHRNLYFNQEGKN